MKKVTLELDNVKLVVLWLFVILNILFRDVHQLILKSQIEAILTGSVNGTEITEISMLVGGFIVEIPLIMLLVIVFSKTKFVKVVNIISALLYIPILFFSSYGDLDDYFFLTMEVAALVAIAISSYKLGVLKKIAST